MSADDFRKDWKPLLVKESTATEWVRCCLEKFQNHSEEEIRLAASVFPPEIALLVETAAQKLKAAQTDQLYESLDPALTNFWDKSGKEKIRREMTKMITPQN